MLLTKREEQLLKAFRDYGKLSLKQIAEILHVSQRTVYRTLSELTESLQRVNVALLKADGTYYLSGPLENLSEYSSLTTYSQNERLTMITLQLLVAQEKLTNETLQDLLGVSNVTIIQDIADIEARLADFEISLERKNGYRLGEKTVHLRRFLAILLTNAISLSDFWSQTSNPYMDSIDQEKLSAAKSVFQAYQADLPKLDAKMSQFFIILLALSGWGSQAQTTPVVSRMALDFSQKIYRHFSEKTATFYTIQEILYYASILDELVIKRQESPLFSENFDSGFFYMVSNLIDKVSLYTKINFAKDSVLFKFLFTHIRLSLAVPIIFNDDAKAHITHVVVHRNEHLYNVVALLIKELFPKYLQGNIETELVVLHFASSLRRSPDIYPIRLLLLTDERPLARELLMTRIKTIAPFVESISVATPAQFKEDDKAFYHCVLATKPQKDTSIYRVSVYPDVKETLALQDYLQEVQAHQGVIIKDKPNQDSAYDIQAYLLASQYLLKHFRLETLDNSAQFDDAVREIIGRLDCVSDKQYLSQKLLDRFQLSPLAIPETHLALLHTQSSKVTESYFGIFELKQPVKALSMNFTEETTNRMLVMLTKMDESDDIRDLMTAISQSLIENHLYTEIYKTGNQDIIYQLLNQIFTEKIKTLEN